MKNIYLFAVILLLSLSSVTSSKYIVLGWNDLGMHCANKSFATIAILPPYNNFIAQVIKTGDLDNNPQLITDSISIEYSIPGNTYSVGKTDVWTYVEKLFGVKLADNIGLTGNGLTGTMKLATDHFIADGIPVTPYQDNKLTTETPFQLARLVVKRMTSEVLATTENVIPVSNEISCVSSGCHNSEDQILNEHSEEGGFTSANKPIICAKCHGSNALGMPGRQDLGSLSYVIHRKHGSRTNDCYKCHPGPKTQCFRDAMYKKGKVCQDCHGSVSQVASSQNSGRRPWIDEPSCGQTGCHTAKYVEETGKLYRNSKGHKGIYCSACHGSPHAIVPTVVVNDNMQNMKLQGFVGKLKKCSVCHGYIPSGKGPHDFKAPQPADIVLKSPANDSTGVKLNHPLIWNTGTNCDSYHLQVSTDEFFTTVTMDTIVADTTFKPDFLALKTKYFWRLTGGNAYGEGYWSNTWNFTTTLEQSVYEEMPISAFLLEFNNSLTSAIMSFKYEENIMPEIHIINLIGIMQPIGIETRSPSDGYFRSEMNISKLNSGIYFILFKNRGLSHVEKFVIQR